MSRSTALLMALAASTAGVAAGGGERHPHPAVPFVVGVAVGGFAGTVVGTLLSRHTAHLIAALIGVIDRRLSGDDDDKLPFELLLQ